MEPTFSWDYILENVARRPGMYVPGARYDAVTAFVDGYDLGRGDGFYCRFEEWVRSQHVHRRELTVPGLLCLEIFGKDHVFERPMDENADRWAVSHFFARLREFSDLERSREPRAEEVVGGE